jgi:hypothetical protein
MLSHTIVFIGTRLDEPPLWQHLSLRGSRGGPSLADLRPGSYLVTPTLDIAKRALLAEHNVTWVPLTAEEFATEVLSSFSTSKQKGLEHLHAISSGAGPGTLRIPEVATLATSPLETSDFLVGAEPIWADIQSGRAIPRECDELIWSKISAAYSGAANTKVLIIAGTAGSGKSASLMRASLRLSSEGVKVGWIDSDSDIQARDIRRIMRASDPPKVLAIDDADTFRAELAPTLIDLVAIKKPALILLGIRSGKVDRVLNYARLEGIEVDEVAMPDLEDSDITSLLRVLDRENRLGILKGRPKSEQAKIFREKAGRQLLVAMYEATSGQRFEEKVFAELKDLVAGDQVIYAIVAVATAFRFPIAKDEVLLASGDRSNVTLNSIDQLVRRKIIISGSDGSLRARHRVIAETLRNELQEQGMLAGILPGMALMAAAKAQPGLLRSSKPWRLLRALLNHDFLFRSIGIEPSRNLYGNLEAAREWDYHYWLQRGSLEVEFGNLALAQNFLNQARGLGAGDPLVETAWAYLLFRQAIEKPSLTDSGARVSEATLILEDYIRQRGDFDSVPFHVLGSQGLAWSRRGIPSRDRRATYLRSLLKKVSEGLRKHPKANDLRTLKSDLQAELLGLTVRPRR